ncbi:MAG: lytic transglycosylase domain-containing protein [bacterium]
MNRFVHVRRPVALIWALLLCLTLPLTARAGETQEIAALNTAMQLVAKQDWEGAYAAALSAGPVGADVVEWSRLRAGDGFLGDYEAFLKRRADWPGLPFLKEQGEVAVARSDDPARVIAYFGNDQPQTGTGAVALIRAYDALGRTGDATKAAVRAWTELKLTSADQAALLDGHRADVKVGDEVRLDRILWDGDRSGEATRMLPLVSKGWVALAQARMALRVDQNGVTALIAAVPNGLQDDAGLAFERFLYRMRHDTYADAATLILDRSTSAARLGVPEAWAERRILLARYLMRTGSPRDAYNVASQHFLTGGSDYAELEFLAGYIALRKLNDPGRALKHFARLQGASNTPITQARAFYWTGRAEQDAGRAKEAYQKAAQFQTSYYGLLAAEKLGLNLDPAVLANKRPADWHAASFVRSSVFEAAWRLYKADQYALSARFMLHLGESLSNKEYEQLSDYALQAGQYRTAVLIAKAAIDRDLVFARPYFPVPDMVPDGLAVSRALALSIARRESEFDPGARSRAGALGLMQVMPDTGAHMAKELGLDFTVSKMTSDPAFNVRLGAEYLKKMVDEFGPSVALIASGYNAGPRRPRDWIAANGDPRLASVDVVDWVENIPFAETRTYVMRVAEGVVIYRAKLRGSPGPVKITAELTGR